MVSTITGIVLFAAGVAGIWYFKPRNGQVHWHTRVPFLDSMIPILVVTAFAVAVALIVNGIAGMT